MNQAGAPEAVARERQPVPLVVVGGWLGAGKTTLVNHLLRNAQRRRIAVLVNDFGAVAIDADLIEGALAADVLALAGGCICCSFGADLVGALGRVAARDPAPDVVLIECSGVALPRAVARSAALVPGVAVEGVVVVVDGEQVRALAADRYAGDTVRRQLAEADLLLVNKGDLADLAAVQSWLDECVPGVPLVVATMAQVPPEVVLGLHVDEAARARTPGWRRLAAGLIGRSPAAGQPPVDRFSKKARTASACSGV